MVGGQQLLSRLVNDKYLVVVVTSGTKSPRGTKERVVFLEGQYYLVGVRSNDGHPAFRIKIFYIACGSSGTAGYLSHHLTRGRLDKE